MAIKTLPRWQELTSIEVSRAERRCEGGGRIKMGCFERLPFTRDTTKGDNGLTPGNAYDRYPKRYEDDADASIMDLPEAHT
ncbi:hypothetical protein GE061_015925 [Apolygus lucorum]|uniref:Uncharacterized protein n=1 Tax=Apolygus lucorum TaxID=248454 RepID=A0A6A4K6F7_APOLU|nr:hypothetical protein GE061_015925 [Apolygus lucorum]